jgi:hypothetical protein
MLVECSQPDGLVSWLRLFFFRSTRFVFSLHGLPDRMRMGRGQSLKPDRLYL